MTEIPVRKISRRSFIRYGTALTSLLLLPATLTRQFQDGNTAVRESWGAPDALASFADLTVSTCGRYRAQGQRIMIRGTIRSTRGEPLRDIRVMLFQSAANGSHRHPGVVSVPDEDPGFRYHGICFSDESGRFEFRSVLPGNGNRNSPGNMLRCSGEGFRPVVTGIERGRLSEARNLGRPLVYDLTLCRNQTA